MSLFRKLFGLKDNSEESIKSEQRGKYMPDVKLPIDERFTINFKANGGKFLYCENMDEVFDSFKSILHENDWEDKEAFVLDSRLASLFKDVNLKNTRNIPNSTYFLSTCEYPYFG